MASLVEELIVVMETEEKLYQKMVELGEKKKKILIQADIPALDALTVQEQAVSDELIAQINRQGKVLGDIADVLGRSEQKITVTKLIKLMESQKEAKEQLMCAKDRLLAAANQLKELNQQNEKLLKQAIEITEFDITLLRSMRQAPETANYNRNACNAGSILGSSGFDAKQ